MIMGLPGTLNLSSNKNKLKPIVLVEPRRLSSLLVIHIVPYAILRMICLSSKIK